MSSHDTERACLHTLEARRHKEATQALPNERIASGGGDLRLVQGSYHVHDLGIGRHRAQARILDLQKAARPTGAEHTSYLAQGHYRIRHVLDDPGAMDVVERLVGNRQIYRVSDDI